MKLPKSIPALITRCLAVWKAMSADKQFADCDPPLTQVKTNIDALQDAQVDVAAGKPGAVAIRKEKEAAVRADFAHIKMYLQRKGDADPTHAVEIFQAANCDTAAASTYHKPEHEIYDGDVSGEVGIRLLAVAKRASYLFQCGLDQVNWISSPIVFEAQYVFKGLTPGQKYYLRWQVTTSDGTGNWSQIVTWIVR
jgi:hypothetical protein